MFTYRLFILTFCSILASSQCYATRDHLTKAENDKTINKGLSQKPVAIPPLEVVSSWEDLLDEEHDDENNSPNLVGSAVSPLKQSRELKLSLSGEKIPAPVIKTIAQPLDEKSSPANQQKTEEIHHKKSGNQDSSSQNMDDPDGFSLEQAKQKDEYIKNPEKLLVDIITDLRNKGRDVYIFDKEMTPTLQSTFSRFDGATREFLSSPKYFCIEELEIINSMDLFINYINAKKDLTQLYKPKGDHDFKTYMEGLKSKFFKEKKESIETVFNRSSNFTILDLAKQEAWFRAFYDASRISEKHYETLFSSFIEHPVASAAKGYLFTKEKPESVASLFSLCEFGFKGKCAAEKMEYLDVWFSKARNGQIPSNNKELENSDELSKPNYYGRLKAEYESPKEFVTLYLNALFTDEKDKPAVQQKTIISQLTNENDPKVTTAINFFTNKVSDYVKNYKPKIKVKVKTTKGEKISIKTISLHKGTDTKNYLYMEEPMVKEIVREIIVGYFF